MENCFQTLPPPPLSPFSVVFDGSFSSHLTHISFPLSPVSFPSSPSSLSPATGESSQSFSPLSLCSSSCQEDPGPDQDDLTCLSWLHQRGDLLPIQPIPRVQPPPPPGSVPCLPPGAGKPPYSFSSLIFMAIEDSPLKRLPVKDIYEWIVSSFPYYRSASGGWRNSVRHNLSLSKSFRRIQRDKTQSVGKGSLWCVCSEYRPALLEMLRKTHSYHSNNSSLINKPELLEDESYELPVVCDALDVSDPLSQSLMLSAPGSQILTSDPLAFAEHPPCLLTPDHEELVTMEYQELGQQMDKDDLSDNEYIEFHLYQSQEYQYLVLPGETELDLETVEILQLDAEAQEAAGSLLDLAGGVY